MVRPLLRVTRGEVLACLEQLGQPYRHDSSNDDLRHTRNRLRHEYDRIDIGRVWLMIEDDLPPLKAAVQPALKQLQEDEARE